MKKFLLQTIPYIALIIAFIVIGEILLYRMRENVPVSTIVEKQASASTELYYNKTQFNNVLTTYKYELLKAKNPSIVIAGQSIVLNFRDFFFHPYEKEFFNTGLMIRNLEDLRYFATLIKNNQIKKPEFMVIGFDFGMVLKKNALDRENLLENLKADPIYDYKNHLIAIQRLYLDRKERKVADINVGYGQRGMEGNGYRTDGSFSFKWELDMFLNDSMHYEGPYQGDLINRRNAFVSPIEFEPNKWNKFIATIREYRALGIDFVIYVPPLSDEFYSFAKKDPEFNNFWNQYLAQQEVLKKEGFDVIPFSTPSMLSLNDYYMNNANHPGDIYVAKQFYQYCTSPERKNRFADKIDTNYLKTLLNAPLHNPLSFMRDTLVYK